MARSFSVCASQVQLIIRRLTTLEVFLLQSLLVLHQGYVSCHVCFLPPLPLLRPYTVVVLHQNRQKEPLVGIRQAAVDFVPVPPAWGASFLFGHSCQGYHDRLL